MPGDSEPPRGGKMGPGSHAHTDRTHETPPSPGTVVPGAPPPYHATGVDALSPMLTYVAFPTTKRHIVERIGEVRIPVDKHKTRTIREILEHVSPERFDTSVAVENAVKDVWDRVAQWEKSRGGRAHQRDDTSGRPR